MPIILIIPAIVCLLVIVGLFCQQRSSSGIPSKKRVLIAFVSIGASISLLSLITAESTKAEEVHAFYASKSSNELIIEPVEWILKAIYHDNRLSRSLLPITGYLGRYATQYAHKVANSTDKAVMQAKVNRFQALYKDMLNLHEYDVPTGGFNTFNDWFIRTFKDIDAVRPMQADSSALVSPADSKLLIIPNLAKDVQMVIKEQQFNMAKFLGDEQLAKKFEGGVMMIFRLAPYDYHRYHYPFDCTVSPEQYIKGGYHSVNRRAFSVGVQPLTENKRSYEILTPINTPCSNCTVVMVQVGATAVASIVNGFMDYEKNKLKDAKKVYKKGQELGYFQFGGSTVVLLFPKDTIIPDAQIVKHSKNGFETAVKVRETIATWIVRR